MLDKWNVKIDVQPSGCPHTNFLDSGAWALMEGDVDRFGRHKRTSIAALDNHVNQAWENLDRDKLINVCDHQISVCREIIKGEGSVEYLETIRKNNNKAEIAKFVTEPPPPPDGELQPCKLDFAPFIRGAHNYNVNKLLPGNKIEVWLHSYDEWNELTIEKEEERPRQNVENRENDSSERLFMMTDLAGKKKRLLLKHAEEDVNGGTKWRVKLNV